MQNNINHYMNENYLNQPEQCIYGNRRLKKISKINI